MVSQLIMRGSRLNFFPLSLQSKSRETYYDESTSPLCENMQSEQDSSSDVTLVLKDDKEVKASRNELSAASEFFSALLNNDMRENREGIIRLEYITENVMKDVLDSMRSESVKLTQQNAKDLLEAADYLLFPRLKTDAERFLDQDLSPSNCITTYYFAEKHQCEGLLLNAKKFILSHFPAVAESQEFLNLESQKVAQWICSDEIAVSSEEDVFEIIVKWLSQNITKREGKFEELFRHVRLAFISRDYLRSHVVTNDLVKKNSTCLKLVKDTMKSSYRVRDDRLQSPRKWSDTHLILSNGTKTVCYEPDKNIWYQLADGPRDWRFTSGFQGNLYVFGSSFVPAYVYDPSLNRWSKLDWTVSKKIHMEHVTVVKGKMHAIVQYASPQETSRDSSRYSRYYILQYNVESNKWVERFPLGWLEPGDLDGACIVAMENHLYFVGGYWREAKRCLTKASRYNVFTDKLDIIAEMKMARSSACGVAAHGKIFIAGGTTTCKVTTTCEVYDGTTNEWQFIESLNAPRSSGSMVCLKGSLYVVGGLSNSSLVAECYDFEEKVWKEKTKLPPSIRLWYAGTLTITKGGLDKPTGLLSSFKHLLQWK